MTEPLDLRIDVAAALPIEITGGEPLHIAAWVFLPDTVPERPTVISLLAGGTYDRRYFNASVPGRSDYSLAEYLRARGHIRGFSGIEIIKIYSYLIDRNLSPFENRKRS